MKRADLKVGMRVRSRSQWRTNNMIVLAVEPWRSSNYGSRFEPTYDGKGTGVAVAVERRDGPTWRSDSGPPVWEPGVVACAQLLPAEEVEDREEQERQDRQRDLERIEAEVQRRKHRSHELSILTGWPITITHTDKVVLSADDFTAMVRKLRGE